MLFPDARVNNKGEKSSKTKELRRCILAHCGHRAVSRVRSLLIILRKISKRSRKNTLSLSVFALFLGKEAKRTKKE